MVPLDGCRFKRLDAPHGLDQISLPPPLLHGGTFQRPQVVQDVDGYLDPYWSRDGRQGTVVQAGPEKPAHPGPYPAPLSGHGHEQAPGWNHVRPDFDFGAFGLSDRCLRRIDSSRG
jgi:hypothetical protein